MTLLVIIISYALQVKYNPYMSTAEYEEVVDKNHAMIDEVVSAKLQQLKMMQHVSARTKAAKLGRDTMIDFGVKAELSFLHNYNTVESTLLFSALIVNLSGVMFESGQLKGAYLKGLTYFVILLVVASVGFFVWVLSTEVWVAFFPDKPFLNIPCLSLTGGKNEEEEGKAVRDTMVFDTNPLGDASSFNENDGGKMEQVEAELNKMWSVVAEKDKLIKSQQDEIRNLRKGEEASRFKSVAGNVMAIAKQKKAFGSTSKDLTTSKRPSGVPDTMMASMPTAVGRPGMGPMKQKSEKGVWGGGGGADDDDGETRNPMSDLKDDNL
jgi:hypothetical protein